MGDPKIRNKGNANGAKPNSLKSRRVSNEILPFAVYVEKFDSSNKKIKLSDADYTKIRTGVFDAF